MIEHRFHVRHDATGNEMAGKVGAADECRVARKLMGAFERTVNADLGQCRGDALRTGVTPGPEPLQASDDCGCAGVEGQTHDMHGVTGEGHRNLHPGHEPDPQLGRRPRGDVEPTQLIVIGERKQFHAVCLRTPHHVGWIEPAVGHGGVAVKVGVEQVHAGKFLRRSGKTSCHGPSDKKNASMIPAICSG